MKEEMLPIPNYILVFFVIGILALLYSGGCCIIAICNNEWQDALKYAIFVLAFRYSIDTLISPFFIKKQ